MIQQKSIMRTKDTEVYAEYDDVTYKILSVKTSTKLKDKKILIIFNKKSAIEKDQTVNVDYSKDNINLLSEKIDPKDEKSEVKYVFPYDIEVRIMK
jgi:hypothetical protein